MRRIVLAAALSLTAPLESVTCQTPDTLRLAELRIAAFANDPRASQQRLLAQQSALRLRNIGAEALPALSIDAMGQYQSDVVSLPVTLPGVTLPIPKHDTYDARLLAQQRIYDPSTAPRRAAERAQLAESQSRLRSELYSIGESVNNAFFAALRAQTQAAEIETAITDLEAQVAVADARVKAGTALPGESAALRAEILRRRQGLAEQASIRRGAIAALSSLVGRRIDPETRFSLPLLAGAVTTARAQIDTIRSRPEYEQFARAREVLERAEDIRSAQEKPRVTVFGRAGYGRPGLNPLTDRFDTYWITGVQVQWSPWSWGSARRDREVTALQRQIVTTQEAAFTEAVERAVDQEISAIERLQSVLALDDQIVALRESILAETRLRYAESVVTSAEYVDKQTDVLSARLTRAIRRVELSQAQAKLLTTLGVDAR